LEKIPHEHQALQRGDDTPETWSVHRNNHGGWLRLVHFTLLRVRPAAVQMNFSQRKNKLKRKACGSFTRTSESSVASQGGIRGTRPRAAPAKQEGNSDARDLE